MGLQFLCCISCVAVFFFAFIPLTLLRYSTVYDIIARKPSIDQSTQFYLENEKKTAVTQPSHTSDTMIPLLRNSTHDPCKQPQQHACDIEGSISENIAIHNRKIVERIVNPIARTSKFYSSCTHFHENVMDSRVMQIVSTPEWIDQMNIISSLPSHEKLEVVFEQLRSYGVKSPFEISFTLQGYLYIHRPFTPITPVKSSRYPILMALHKASGFKTDSFIHVGKTIEASLGPGDSTTAIRSSNEIVGFDLSAFIGNIYRVEYEKALKSLTGRIDLFTLRHFSVKVRRSFTVEQWKEYLRFLVYMYAIRHYRLDSEFSHDIDQLCIRQYKQLFPLSVCTTLRNEMEIPEDVLQYITKLRKSYIEYFEQNQFQFTRSSILVIKENIEKTQWYVNTCWMLPDFSIGFQDVIEMEKRYLNIVEGPSSIYLSIVSQIHTEKFFQSYRHDDDTLFIRDLGIRFATWEAWSSSNSKSIYVPPGFLHYIVTRMDLKSIAAKTHIGNGLAHEQLHQFSQYLSSNAVRSKEWTRFENHVSRVIPVGKLHENLADIIGTMVNYRTISPKDQRSKQVFFLTHLRLWCKNSEMSDHASGSLRVISPLILLHKEYEDAFQCKLPENIKFQHQSY